MRLNLGVAALMSIAASALSKVQLEQTRIHGVDDLGSDIHQSSFGSDVHLAQDATVQYTFYTSVDNTRSTPISSIISFVDAQTGEYWEDVVGIRASDGRGRYTMRSSKFPLKSPSLDVKLFVATDGDSGVLDVGKLSFSEDFSRTSSSVLPEITHTFKTEPKHTPAAISGVAALLINGAPLLGLLVLVGAHVSLQSTLTLLQLSSLTITVKQTTENWAFIGAVVAFEALLLTYWVKLTLFQFLPFAAANALAVFMTGNQALRALKSRREGVSDVHTDKLRFMHLLEHAKTQKRTGWLRSGVKGAESISDHMWRMSIMSIVVADDSIDFVKASQMATVHDIAECIVGDIAPSDNIPKTVKIELERTAMIDIVTRYLHNSSQAKYLMQIWEEYEHQSSLEAVFVKDLDRLEMCLQAFEYEKADNNLNLESFYSSLNSVRTEQVRVYGELLLEERKQMHSNR
ncbi:hypothetical protein E3P99_00537 [Wallemia hederae]|uniref:5'-deoxynucleotidase n=1 Tax=Wallemia hederae TaxID=1540922 RepID=A0A4T0FUW0_9BASI|nr:hypothetical protein E3P99_00537 [Wallemia hederae]